jgi:hypothetical protein
VHQTHDLRLSGGFNQRGLLAIYMRRRINAERGVLLAARRHFISNNSVIGMRDGLLYDDSTSAALIQVPPYCVRRDLWPALLRYKSQVLHSRARSHTIPCVYVVLCTRYYINTQTRARPQRCSTTRDDCICGESLCPATTSSN